MPPAARIFAIWACLGAVILSALGGAAMSPLLQWRSAIYNIASFAGILAMSLMLIQPLLAARLLPLRSPRIMRFWHISFGLVLILAILVHVGGLWITSPPDVVDALLLRSPTPFSVWGVVAMWAIFVAGGLAFWPGLKRGSGWRLLHSVLVGTCVWGTVVHALLIDGAMGAISKAVLAGCIALAAISAFAKLRLWARI